MTVNLQSPLATKIRKQVTQALNDFDLLQNNDKLMVCVSGGKDSSILLASLVEIQKRAEIDFQFEAVILDQKQPGFNVTQFKTWVENLGVKLHILERDTYSIVLEKSEGKTYCTLCSRMRRAILYDFAVAHGFTKMALGHHKNDVINTALLNMFYIGTMATMPAKLKSDDGRNIVVRPLVYVAEEDLQQLAIEWQIPIIPCNLCGSQDGLKRQKMKKLIQTLKADIPNIEASFLTALGNVKPSHLLDHQLFDFKELSADLPAISGATESNSTLLRQ